jgi:hypothetical protein
MPKPGDPEESKRFIDMAREVEVDESAWGAARTIETPG